MIDVLVDVFVAGSISSRSIRTNAGGFSCRKPEAMILRRADRDCALLNSGRS
jgi:hypothetical protein